MNLGRSTNGSSSISSGAGRIPAASAERKALNEESFQRMISLERKRTERSRKSLVLMLLAAEERLSANKTTNLLHDILMALTTSTRETDVTGWHKCNSVVGVMFTEVGLTDKTVVLSAILGRVGEVLRERLTVEQFAKVNISFHSYPDDWEQDGNDGPGNSVLYPDLLSRHKLQRWMNIIKRMMDIVGSILMLVLLCPLLLLIAAAISIWSPGPVFFRQRRVGQHGRTFELLKFRSMHVNNDPAIHREYSTRVITGIADKQLSTNKGGVYKLTADPRVTRPGYWLRRSSLDELPQLFNVLMGEMSLVGPRPPLDYEVKVYDLWHRARLLEAKPGITGLWQVSGRNRVKFDDMVRLDLIYARTWSPWLDLKILLRTPGAVLQGAH